jgi:hypothetical protein
MSEKKLLCPDPDCNTENEASAESCTKCGLDLPAFFALDRTLSVRDKIAKKADEDRIKKEKESAPKKSRGGLAGLIGGNKK